MPFSMPRPVSEILKNRGARTEITAADLIKSMVDGTEELPMDTCWRCPGETRDADGYGKVYYRGRQVYGHRLAFTFWWLLDDDRDIPTEVDGRPVNIDHVAERGCKYKDCISPWHLEIVFRDVNNSRGSSPSARNARKEICPRGHKLAGTNLHTYSDGRRECDRCRYTKGGADNYIRCARKDIPTATRSQIVADVLDSVGELPNLEGSAARSMGRALAAAIATAHYPISV